MSEISFYSLLIPVIAGAVTWKNHGEGLRILLVLCVAALLFSIFYKFAYKHWMVYHLWTPIEIGLIFWMFSKWTDKQFGIVYLIFLIVWCIVKISLIEYGEKLDSYSLIIASSFTIFPCILIACDKRCYVRTVSIFTGIYFIGCWPLFIAYNMLEDGSIAWNIHSLFDTMKSIAYGAAFIECTNRSLYYNDLVDSFAIDNDWANRLLGWKS